MLSPMSTFRAFGSPTWALIPNEKHQAMEKKSQPLIFVGYCEDMKAYRLFDPISKEVFLRRAVCFDEGFNPTSSPSPPSNCHVDDGVDHADIFAFVEEDNEHLEDENQPSTPIEHGQPEQGQLDLEQHLRRRFREWKRPDRYGYESTDLSYFAFAPRHI